jgi:hypothetical protein
MCGFGAELEWSDWPPSQLLDVTQVGPFLVAAERDCRTGGTGARGSADAVNIIFRHVWQLEVDHV